MENVFFENFLENTNRNYLNKKPFVLKLLGLLFYSILFIFILTLIFNFVFIKAQVVGISMMPTYNKNLDATHTQSNAYYENSPYKDIVYANRFEKGTNGDIVLLTLNNDLVIKRIIATAGQKVTLKQGNGTNDFLNFYYYINDKLLDEPYIYSREHMDLNYFNRFCYGDGFTRNFNVEISLLYPQAEFVVPEGQIFVLGDNRYASADSTVYGTVKQENIFGKVVFSYDYNQTFYGFLWQKICSIF